MAAGGFMAAMASATHSDYEAATDPGEARRLKSRTQSQARAANILFGVGAAAVLAGAGMLIWHHAAGEPSASGMVVPVPDGAAVVIGAGF